MLKAVAYCRLSREDGDDNVSSSIINQKKIIEDYAIEHNITITEYYIDDGKSGHTMDRPAFNRLKHDLNNDKIDTIIAKDLSRIGRHDAKVQIFLEGILEAGKRVITIGDNYDSHNTQSHDMVGIQTWMNEKYIRDISNKIRKAIDSMQKEGRFVSSIPYGYCMDEAKKGTYHIDETCAMYVKEIFDMYLSGLGVSAIATDFSKRNIPTSSMITKRRLERQGKTYKGHVATKWAPNVIMNILKNDFYIGTLTTGKTKRRSINGKKTILPEENYHVFENAHEPIIDKQTFKLVQEAILERQTKNYRGKRIQTRPNIFISTLYCADCGKHMTSTGCDDNTRYVCRTYNYYGTAFCTSHGVLESTLTEALIYFLEHCKENLSEAIKDLDKFIKDNNDEKSNDIIETLEDDLKRVEIELRTLLEQKMRETMKNPLMADMIDDMYSKMINEKYIEINSLKTQIQDQQKNDLEEGEILENLNSAMDIFNNIIYSKKITKRQVDTIVDKIVVHEDGGLDIYLKGNLHELCTNYIQIKNTNKGKILQATIDYIKDRQDHIYSTHAYEYTKLQGNRIGYPKYIQIFNILVDSGYIIQNEERNGGYRLITTFEKLKEDFLNHTIDYSSTWVTKNYVTFEMLINICKWVSGLEYSRAHKKHLF